MLRQGSVSIFFVEYFSGRIGLSIDTLIDDHTLVVAKKSQFEEQDISIKMPILKVLDYGDCDARHNAIDFQKSTLQQLEKVRLRPKRKN